MKTIYKYQLANFATLDLPVGAKAVLVEMQNGSPHIWFEHNRSAFKEQRFFRIYGTGFDIPDNSIHIGSVIDGMFVWHIYEVKQ